MPRAYTILADEFQFAPIPDLDYTVQMLYYAAPPYMSNSNPSNVFLANCADALLYASLGNAETYLMNDPRLPMWAQLYQNAIDGINAADDSTEHSASPLSIHNTLR